MSIARGSAQYTETRPMPRHLLTSTPLSDDADVFESDLLDGDFHDLHVVGEMVLLIGVERLGYPFLTRNRAKP